MIASRPLFRTLTLLCGILLLPRGLTAGPPDADDPFDASSPSSALRPEPVDWESVTLFGDLGAVLGTTWHASYDQILHTDTLATLGVGSLATWLAFDRDDDWLIKLQQRDYLDNDIAGFIGDEVALAITAVPAITWWLSTRLEDDKLRSYSIDTTSSIALAYAETVLLANFVPTHGRPRDESGDPATSFFDTAFRGKYSFPSGHIIAPLTITLKTWDYYGWKAALVPAGVTLVSGFNRISDGSHYPSDIVGAVVLSVSAHLATRRESAERNGGIHWGAAPLPGGGLMINGAFDF